MNEKPSDVLIIEELFTYVKIPRSMLCKLVREGKIPSQKVDRHWRFGKVAIDRWRENLRGKTNDNAHEWSECGCPEREDCVSERRPIVRRS